MTQRILITGAASGLGKALALCFANADWQVCVADIQPERGEETVAEIRALGKGDAFFQLLNVTESSDFVTAISQMKTHWGGIDAIINNAGVASGGPFEWIEESMWDWMLNINLMGVVRGCLAAVNEFKLQGHGHIINIASMAGLLNPPGMANYNVAKAGVISLSETLRAELAPCNIQVTCVCPSFFKTNLTETMRSADANMTANLERFMEHSELTAEDIARLIFNAFVNKEFLVLPHEKARMAYEVKVKTPEVYFQESVRVAESVRRKAGKPS